MPTTAQDAPAWGQPEAPIFPLVTPPSHPQAPQPSPHAFLPMVTSATAVSATNSNQVNSNPFNPNAINPNAFNPNAAGTSSNPMVHAAADEFGAQPSTLTGADYVDPALAQFASATPVPMFDNQPAGASKRRKVLMAGGAIGLVVLLAAGFMIFKTVRTGNEVKSTFDQITGTLPSGDDVFGLPTDGDAVATPIDADASITASGDTGFDDVITDDVITDEAVIPTEPVAPTAPAAPAPPVNPPATAPTVQVKPAAFGADGFLTGATLVDPGVCGNNQPGAYQLQFASCTDAHNVKILRSMTFPAISAELEATLLSDCQAERASWPAADQGLGAIERITYPQANGGALQVCFVRYAQ